MRVITPVLACSLFLFFAPALGNPLPDPVPPLDGTYMSMDLPGGTILSGHFSESWVDPGDHGQIGNTINAQSWDLAALGTEWKLWCASIVSPPILVSDTRDGNGTGEVTWRTMYGGGRFWLSKDGPWSLDHTLDFLGDVESLIATTTYQYVFGDLIGIRSNITTIGTFDLFPDMCMEYSINNTAFFGSTDIEPKPGEFPAFLDPDACPSENAGLNRGGWGSVTEITLVIHGCIIPVEPTTWSDLKIRFE